MKKIFLTCLLISSVPTFACSCYEMTLEKHFESVKNVYYGQLISAQYEAPNKENDWPSVSGIIDIKDVLKGEKLEQISIKTGLGGGDCGISLTVGKYYSLFVNRSDEYISICDASKQMDTIEYEDLKQKIDTFLRRR